MGRAVTFRIGLAFALAASAVPTRADPPPDIEIYHGTRKVSPLPKPLPDPAAGPKAVATVAATFHDATASALASTSHLVGRMIERTIPKWEAPRFPVVVNVTLPPTPAPPPAPVLPVSASQPAYLPWVRERPEPREEAKPTVIILREPAPVVAPPLEVRTEPPPVRGANELLLAVVAAFGGALLVTMVGLRWRSRSTPKTEAPKSSVTFNGLNAGELPDLPEKFEVGPTFADERAEKQEAEKAGAAAMLQHILDENLNLRTEIANT